MKLNNKELWLFYSALNQTAGNYRAINRPNTAKIYEKLANKIEKELLK